MRSCPRSCPSWSISQHFLYFCIISLFNHVDCSCVFSTKFMLLILRNHTLKCILSLNKEKTISVLCRYLRMFQFIIHIKHNIFKQFQVLVNTTFCFKAVCDTFLFPSSSHPSPLCNWLSLKLLEIQYIFPLISLVFFYFNSAFSMKLLINHLLFMY